MSAYLRGTDVLGAAGKEPSTYDRAAQQAAQEFAVVEETVKKVNARVNPWLWILSITGFSLSIFEFYNRYRKGMFWFQR